MGRPSRRARPRLVGRCCEAVLVCALLTAGLAPSHATAAPGGWLVAQLPAGPSFSEPGLADGPGVLLAGACTANAGASAAFWRSTDDGLTWSRAFTLGDAATGCGDVDTAVGPDGYEYALVLGNGVEVYRSRDGRTWSGPATFPPPHGEDQPDRPWLVPVPRRPNVLHVFNSEIGGDVVEWTSTDHARTFSGPVPVTGGLNSQAALTITSRPLVDPAHPERMRLFYETAALAGVTPSTSFGRPDQFPFTQLWQAVTTDGGRSWSNQRVLDVTAAFHARAGTLGHLLPASAIDRAGTVYVVLSVQLGHATATHLFLLHSTRSGGWSAPVRLDRAGASNVYPAVAAGPPGHLVVGWYGSNAASFSDPAARWFELAATTTRGSSPHPSFTFSRLGAAPVHVGAIEQAGAIGFDLGEDWSLRDFQSAVVDGCGRQHLAWASDYGDRRRVFTATSSGRC